MSIARAFLPAFTWVALAAAAVSGCVASPEDGEDVDSTAEFLSSPDDEVIDPNDPPDDPDPAFDDDAPPPPPAGETGTTSSALSKHKKKKHKKGAKPDNGAMGCGTAGSLSPSGLTLVFHVSKDDATAARMVQHLEALKGYVRQRDLFMVDHGSPAVAHLRALFPCNRFHTFVREPNQLAATLASADGYEGVAVDWELYDIRSHDQAWSTRRLAEFADKIHAHGKSAGFIPFWFGKNFDDKAIMHGSHMQYDLLQIQSACVSGAAQFGKAARDAARGMGAGGVRDLGFEISMDSYGNVDNHVSAARAAACTEMAYRKGARAIYVYGNGPDQLPEYFGRLGKAGVRRPE